MLVVKICEQGQPRIVSLDLAILYSGMLLAKARRETIFPQASYMAGGRQSTSSSPSSITVDNIFYKELSNAILSYGGVWGRNFCPPSLSAAAEFRISFCEMRRQKICLIKFMLFGSIIIQIITLYTIILPKLYLYDKWKNNQ